VPDRPEENDAAAVLFAFGRELAIVGGHVYRGDGGSWGGGGRD
jgi:hypothetical protein